MNQKIKHLPASKFFITGGNGFLGSHIVPFLLDQGHTIVVLDNLSTGKPENLPKENPHLTIINGSVLDGELVRNSAKGCDFILHLASTVGMKLVYDRPEQSFQVSKVGTENIFSTPTNIPVILFSSSAVYGLTNTDPIQENTSITLQDALNYDGQVEGYAVGKWTLEHIGKSQMETGRKIMILRPFNVIGPRQSSDYGMVVPNFIKNSFNNKPLTIYDDGNQTRSFTAVETFTKCLYNLIQNPQSWEPGNNIINIGSKHNVSINHLAKVVLSATKSSSKIEYRPYKSVFPNKVDVKHRIPNLDRLTKLIGEVEWYEIQEIVDQLLKSNNEQSQPDLVNSRI